MKNNLILSLIASILIIVGAVWWAGRVKGKSAEAVEKVSPDSGQTQSVGDKQEIEILARGGYWPRRITARAGVPLVLKIKTDGGFDCSRSLVIPDLNYRKLLDPIGEEEILLSANQARGTLRGLCSMGMYSLLIDFQ
ncbi:MAG: hypothetical protein Q8O49_00785 [bacterium]|nr:hypothetical protein [bacterium]